MEKYEIIEENFKNKKPISNGIDISEINFQGKEDSYSYN